MKRTAPLLIAATVGFIIIFSTFIPYTESWGEDSMIWFDILAAVAFVLGGGNLLKMNLKKVSDRRPGWAYSAIMIAAFLITLTVGLLKVGTHPNAVYWNKPWSGDYIGEGSALWWIYEYLIYPLTSTMFAMLAFYIASAAFRAFRAKNVEASLLLGTAFIVLLGRTYAAIILTGWLPELAHDAEPSFFGQLWNGLRLEKLTETIMGVFNLAGSRAINIGIALGIASTSLKVLLGVDRSYLGTGED